MTAFQTHWERLTRLAQDARTTSIAALFDESDRRVEKFTFAAPGVLADCSKNRLPEAAFSELLGLAAARDVERSIADMFSGEELNVSEGREVLHTALRNPQRDCVDREKARAVIDTLERMESLVKRVHIGSIQDANKITDVVNIGIGGSHLGPALVCDALRDFSTNGIRTHFISNVDGASIEHTLAGLEPQSTLFIIASKSFTTTETLLNAESALEWFRQAGNRDLIVSNHFIGVSSATEKAVAFGIAEENVYPMWDWVGGRYSLWSAIGLPIALEFGFDVFRQLLAGAAAMDDHFLSTKFSHNLPAALGLIGVWQRNFLQMPTRAVVPYDERLRLFPAFLQQLEMESNGKRVSINNETLLYDTAPVVWGGIGTDAQHAFFQLMHQGTLDIPVDFIVCLNPHHDYDRHHDVLFSNCIAQAEALMHGTDGDSPAHTMPGNRSSNILVMDELNPFNLGALIATYEHRTMFQAAIWEINAFDQFGVELGKRLAATILNDLETGACDGHDPSTNALINYYLKRRRD